MTAAPDIEPTETENLPQIVAPDAPLADLPAGVFSASAIAREHGTVPETVCRVARQMGLAPAGDEPLHSWEISEQDARKLAIGISIHQHFSRWQSAARSAKKIALLKAMASFPDVAASDIGAFIKAQTAGLPTTGPDVTNFPTRGEEFARAFLARRAGNDITSDFFDESINDTIAKLADLGRDFAWQRNPEANCISTEDALEALLSELERKAGLAPAEVVAVTLPSGIETGGSIYEQYKDMKPGADRQAFFAKHKAKILSAHARQGKNPSDMPDFTNH